MKQSTFDAQLTDRQHPLKIDQLIFIMTLKRHEYFRFLCSSKARSS